MLLRSFSAKSCILLVGIGLCTCNRIYEGKQLSSAEIAQISALGLLKKNEKIYQFYSNFKGVGGAGNFYTTKRIAHYWHHHDDKQVDFAYYQDISHLSLTPHPMGDFTIPFITVVRKDSTRFRVYVDGNTAEVNSFFSNCRSHWQAGQ
jgi:hypothetical protein